MKIFGSLSRLVSILFRKNGQDLTFRPNQSTTYTAARDLQFPPGDIDHVSVSATSTQTLTNKTLTAPAITGGTAVDLTNLSVADVNTPTNSLHIGSDSAITADRNLFITRDDTGSDRYLGLYGDFEVNGGNITLTTPSNSTVTLPTTGTLSTTDQLDEKADLVGGNTFTDPQFFFPSSPTAEEISLTVSPSDQSKGIFFGQADGGASFYADFNDINVTISGPNPTFSSECDVTIRSGSAILFNEADNTNYAALSAPSLTDNRTFTFPDDSGTLATEAFVTAAVPATYKADWTDLTNTVTFDNTTDTVLWTAHPLINGQALYFSNSGGALPVGLTTLTKYYVVTAAANTFQVATTYGGSPVNFTTDGTGTTTANVTSYKAVHALGTQDVMVTVYDKDDGFEVSFDEVIRVSTSTVIINGDELPGGTGFRVMILAV